MRELAPARNPAAKASSRLQDKALDADAPGNQIVRFATPISGAMRTMYRRTFLLGSLTAPLLGCTPQRVEPSAELTPDQRANAKNRQAEVDARHREITANAVKTFPFELVAVPGSEALATFHKLQAEDRGTPVVLGSENRVSFIADGLSPGLGFMPPTPQQILPNAAQVVHPKDLMEKVARDNEGDLALVRKNLATTPDSKLPVMNEDGRKLSPAEVRTRMTTLTDPPIGQWPEEVTVNELLAMTTEDYKTYDLPNPIYIALIPTKDWTEVPAYLNWGDWNACPPPEYHVAALRSWRDRYGARLVTFTGDCVELQVARKPQTRDEALALAREHYAYNNDLIDQGFEEFAPLAALLVESDVWSFWWD